MEISSFRCLPFPFSSQMSKRHSLDLPRHQYSNPKRYRPDFAQAKCSPCRSQAFCCTAPVLHSQGSRTTSYNPTARNTICSIATSSSSLALQSSPWKPAVPVGGPGNQQLLCRTSQKTTPGPGVVFSRGRQQWQQRAFCR